MEDDQKLSDEELAQVVEDEVLEMDAPRQDFRSRISNIAHGVHSAVDEFKREQEFKKQEKEETDFERAKQEIEEARKRNELTQLREQARSLREQADAPRKERMEQKLSKLKNLAVGIGERFMARRPPSQPEAYTQPQTTPPAFAQNRMGSILLERRTSGSAWLDSGNGGNAPFLQQKKPTFSWLSSGSNRGGSWLFGSKPKRPAQIKRIKRIKRIIRRRK